MANSQCFHQSYNKTKRWVSTSALFSIILLFLFGISTFIVHWIDLSIITRTTIFKTIEVSNNKQEQPQFPLSCNTNSTSTCPSSYPTTFQFNDDSSYTSCPHYFKWIHEDLKPWEKTGITKEMVERGQNMSHFRLVIVNGKAYIEKYAKSFQTRDVFTIWGILQLLRLYPGKIPDLELMFQCGDKNLVTKKHFQGPEDVSPPPLFHYCGDENSFDIVFPDWTFWGWAEVNIRPWETTLNNIQEGNKNVKWKDRIPYAFWKGNPTVSYIRKELVKCNASEEHNVRIYDVKWLEEKSKKFQDTKLENQCTYRYKIYAEGATWSVSNKYIIACDSMTMFIEPRYYDFFTRSMLPLKHYWPISFKNMCEEIKYAVDWGNAHLDSAQAIGEGGTNYIIDNLKMKFVYDYMFHLLNSYAKLLKFKPKIPEGAVEVCAESMACSLRGLRKNFMVESMVMSPSDTPPCTMPPPYTAESLQQFLQEKENLIGQVKTRAMNK
ncbi:O-glucosyltransferase rumi protein [Trifolium repens]|nr:O-glucosyltransferase rumi protein [Trifolium repens]